MKPNSKRRAVWREGDTLVVAVRSPPLAGRANEEARTLLAEFFGVKRGKVRLIRGHKSRVKTFEVDMEG